ncbi:MAG: hypothetical protein JNJ88_14070 [Planctomycetes bacterium]|nr:hypothetical protein [Planctomycetota bacterium]
MEALTKAEFGALVAKCGPVDGEVRRTGQVVMNASLESAMTTIRIRIGTQMLTDRPLLNRGRWSETIG